MKTPEPHPHFLWRDLFKRTSADKKGVTEVLKDNILFKTLSQRELTYLARFVYERIYQPDEPVFSQGDRGNGVYIIARGSIAIKTHDHHQDILVTELHQGSFFGEVALVDPDNLRTASAVALERTVTIGFFKPDLIEILTRKPEMGVKILLQLSIVLGQRLLETTDKISQLKRLSTEPPTSR